MIEHLVGHVVSLFVERRLERDALAAVDAHLGTWRLHHSAFFRWFWTFMAAFWAFPVAGFAWLWARAASPWPIAGGVVLFGVVLSISLLLAWDGWTQEIELSPMGIRELRSGRRSEEIPWSSVVAIHHVSWIDSYVVQGRYGRRVRVAKNIRGLRQFKLFARTYAPPSAVGRVKDRFADRARP
jgi:hypothetical protein